MYFISERLLGNFLKMNRFFSTTLLFSIELLFTITSNFHLAMKESVQGPGEPNPVSPTEMSEAATTMWMQKSICESKLSNYKEESSLIKDLSHVLACFIGLSSLTFGIR